MRKAAAASEMVVKITTELERETAEGIPHMPALSRVSPTSTRSRGYPPHPSLDRVLSLTCPLSCRSAHICASADHRFHGFRRAPAVSNLKLLSSVIMNGLARCHGTDQFCKRCCRCIWCGCCCIDAPHTAVSAPAALLLPLLPPRIRGCCRSTL